MVSAPEIKAAGQNSLLAITKRRLGAPAFVKMTNSLSPAARQGLLEHLALCP